MQTHLLPEPLRGLEQPSFTHYSIVVRLPDIARRTLSENAFSPEVVKNIEQLISEIPEGSIRPVEMASAPGADLWDAWIRPYTGQNWLQVPWFFAEEYFYLRILEASGYFKAGENRPGGDSGYLRDPYELQKRLGLETTQGAIQLLTTQADRILPDAVHFRQTLSRLLLIDLWGNQNDLSLWPASTSDTAENPAQAEMRESVEHLLVDDRSAALAYLASFNTETLRLDFLIDNAGYELVCDLALADVLLSRYRVRQIVFHVKQQPVFVSDALPKDIDHTLDFLKQSTHEPAQSMAARLQTSLASGQFQIKPHVFWTSPLPMWEMPEDLRKELSQSDMLLSKGDANYRRLLGDRHWPTHQPFADVMQYMPVAVLSLRTLKSEIVVGLPDERIPHHDPDWMTDGQWGLIQFARPTSGPSTAKTD